MPESLVTPLAIILWLIVGIAACAFVRSAVETWRHAKNWRPSPELSSYLQRAVSAAMCSHLGAYEAERKAEKDREVSGA